MAANNLDIFVRLHDQASKEANKISKAIDGIGDAGKKVQKLGGALSLGVTAPIVAMGAATIAAANELNEGLANVASLGVKNVEKYKDGIQQIAIDVAKPTADIADGLYQVVSAFGETSETMEILEINAKAAAAGLSTTTEAINLTSAVTAAYGDTSASAVSKVADLAFTAVQMGKTTFPELAGAMGQVTLIANSMGVSQEELFATMAAGSKVLPSTAATATALRGALQGLMSPTADMANLFEDLGYESGEALLKGEGLQEAMALIVAEAEDAKLPLQKFISSIEGQQLALLLTGESADDYAGILDDMGGAIGSTNEAFKAQTEGVNAAGFAWEQLKVKLGVLKEDIGTALLPVFEAALTALQPVIDKVLELANSFANMDPAQQQMIVMIGAAIAALGPTLLVIGTAMTSLAPIVSALGGAMALLVSPLGLIVAGFAALMLMDIGGIGTKISTMFSGGIEDIKAFANYLAAVVKDGDYLNDWLTQIPDKVQPVALELGKLIAGEGSFADLGTAAIDGVALMVSSLQTSLAAVQWADIIAGAMATGGDIAGEIKRKITDLITGGADGSIYGPEIDAARENPLEKIAASFVTSLEKFNTDIVAAVEELDWTEATTKIVGSFTSATIAIDWTQAGQYAARGLLAAVLFPLSRLQSIFLNIKWVFTQDSFGGFIKAVKAGFADIKWAEVGLSGFQSAIDAAWTAFSGAFKAEFEAIPWADIISSPTWDEIIEALVWAGNFVNELSWKIFVPQLKWSDVIKAKVDIGAIVRGWMGAKPGGASSDGPSGDPDNGYSGPTDPGEVINSLYGLAGGTSFWRGGPTWVGERGPEIVNLPRGAQVIPNHQATAATNITINATVASDIDIEVLANRIAQVNRRRMVMA